MDRVKDLLLAFAGRHKKGLLLLLLLAGGGGASVIVVRRVSAPPVLPSSTQGAGAGDVAGVFSRAVSTRDEDRYLPPELAARSGIKSQGGSFGAAVSPENLQSGPGQEYASSGKNAFGSFESASPPPRHSREGGNPEDPEKNGLDSRLRGNDERKGGGNEANRWGQANRGEQNEESRAQEIGRGGQGQSEDENAQDLAAGPTSSGSQDSGGSREESGPGASGGPGASFERRSSPLGGYFQGKTARSKNVGSGGKKAAIKKGKDIGVWSMKDELRSRTGIAYGDGDFSDAETAKGTQNAAWSETQGSGVATPGGGAGGGLGGANLNFQGIDGLTGSDGLAKAKAPTQSQYINNNPAVNYGINFSWRPKLIIYDDQPQAEKNYKGAQEDIIKVWQNASVQKKYLGVLGAVSINVTQLIEQLQGGIQTGFWEQKLNAMIGGGYIPWGTCISVRPDVDITLKLGDSELTTIENCAQESGLPLPYVLRTCSTSNDPKQVNFFQGYESGIPQEFHDAYFKDELPDILPIKDQNELKAGGKAKSVPSGLFRHNPTDAKDPWNSQLPDNESARENYFKAPAQGSVVKPNVKSPLIVQNMGFGIIRLQFGFCLSCDQPNHPSYWPSVYFNMMRNFDGTTYFDKRCLPASLPLDGIQKNIRCTLMGNHEFANKCNLKCLAQFRNNKKFREDIQQYQAQAAQLAPGQQELATEQACDYHFKISKNVKQCIEDNGQWPGPDPQEPPFKPEDVDCDKVIW